MTNFYQSELFAEMQKKYPAHTLAKGCPDECSDPRCIDEYEEYARVSGVDDDPDQDTNFNPEPNDDND